MVIFYPGMLPAGALIDADFTPTPARVVIAPKPLGPPAPIWFSTRDADSLEFTSASRVTGWAACAPSTAHARPVGFNKDGTGWDAASQSLDFVEKTHGGLCVADAISDGSCFSLGLIYTPPPKRDAQTLLSLQAREDESYAFLSAESGFIRFGLKGGEASLHLPDPQRLTLLLLSSDGQRVRMSANRDLAISVACALPAAPLDLFLGCRGGSRSLLGKLGSFQASDLLIWPDQDVLAGEVARAPEAALSLWQERLRNGN